MLKHTITGEQVEAILVEHGYLPLLDRIAVTVKEAAILIGTNDKQIRKALHARGLPAAKLGNAYSIGVADLRKWFDGKKRTL